MTNEQAEKDKSGPTTPEKRLQQAMMKSGADLDIFDFYRSGEEYGMMPCPCCSGQADVWRKDPGVWLTCTKCPFEAEWKCKYKGHDLGGQGSIYLVRADDPRQMPSGELDNEIPF